MANRRIPLSIRQHLNRSTLSLVLGTILVLAISGWLLLLTPAMDSVAHARISQIAALMEGRLDHLKRDSQRLLRNTADWLGSEGLSLDHQSLNRRFMPLLAHQPHFASMSLADTQGSEWMLLKQPGGGWLNRLSAPADQPGKHRFIRWNQDLTPDSDEHQESDYQAFEQRWFKAAMQAPPGQPAWSRIQRRSAEGEPAVTVAMRMPVVSDHAGLVAAVNLRLSDIAHYLNSMRIGDKGLAILTTREGRLLGLSNRANSSPRESLDELLFKPVVGMQLGPLQHGIDLWLGRTAKGVEDRLVFYQNDLWHIGFRKLDIGDQRLWLGVYLPVSELVPGLYRRLMIWGLALLLALAWAGFAAARKARELGRPLNQLEQQSQRIGAQDFTAPPLSPTGIREIDRLGIALEQLHRRLAAALDHQSRQQASAATQARLLRVARQESARPLAGQVAQHLKDPLARVHQGLDSLHAEPATDGRSREILQDMQRAVERAERTTEQLLDFAREQPLELEPGDIAEVIRAALQQVEHELQAHHIRIELHLADDLPGIALDRKRLQQAFVNLYRNAAQAMHDGGTLLITGNCRVLTAHSGLDRDTDGRFTAGQRAIWVEIADSGPGIAEERLARVFEPFFSTREGDEGAGLGLSIARGIVESHQGSLDIRNRTGGGVSAVLLLRIEQAEQDGQ